MKKLFSSFAKGAVLGICYLVVQKTLARDAATADLQDSEEELATNLTIIEERLGPFMMSSLMRGLAREATTDPAGLISSLRYSIKLGS